MLNSEINALPISSFTKKKKKRLSCFLHHILSVKKKTTSYIKKLLNLKSIVCIKLKMLAQIKPIFFSVLKISTKVYKFHDKKKKKIKLNILIKNPMSRRSRLTEN